MMSKLTVITMNCLGLPVPIPGLRRRLQALGRTLATTDADIVCLQEVGRWRHLMLLRYDEARWPFAIAVDYPYAPKGGLVTLAGLPVVDTRFYTFQERGRAVSLHTPERLQGKGMLLAELDASTQNVVVINTHLAANYSAEWSYSNPYTRVERAQLREIAAVVREITMEKLVVVAGDFNIPRGSWLYHEFLSLSGLHDPLGSSTEPTYRPLPGMPARAVQALDHVLIRAPGNLEVDVQSELCFAEPAILAHGARGYLSDHVGVHMSLTWQAIQRREPPHHHALMERDGMARQTTELVPVHK
jgi:endonuclease/exonuclease/phosphatase family metal-dependent hydrolase